MSTVSSFSHVSDKDLLAQTKALVATERDATARLIAALVEIDARNLYLAQGCRSLFTYCFEVLHLSESESYARIEAARVARRVPSVLTLLHDGAINLTTVGLLAPHLTEENGAQLLAAATHKSKRHVQTIVAALKPLPPVPAVVRKLPTAAPIEPQSSPVVDVDGSSILPARLESATAQPIAAAPAKPAVIAPLSPERYKLQLTMSKETHDKLRRGQDLMRHTNPKGDPAVIFDRAITMLLNGLEKTRLGASDRPRHTAPTSSPGSRHIPAAVRREVWKRDEGRCAFVGEVGRCSETGGLEYHHVVPFADGGAAVVSNIQLRCRAHNAYEAELWFGPLVAREERAPYGSNWVRT
jgi:hypothetical protein